MKLEQIINEKYDYFSEGDQVLAKYILDHKDEIRNLSITELAERSLSSKSSVLRFAQKLGFSGYTELKNFIRWELVNHQSHQNYSNYGEIILNDVQKTIEALNMNDILKISQEIDQSSNVYLAGTGFLQQNLTIEMQRIFLGLGKNMQVIPLDIRTDLHQLVVEKMTEDDLLFVFSSTGNNPSIKEALAIPLIKKVKIVAITATSHNWLSSHADYSIHIYSDRDPLAGDSGFSSSVFYCIIEMLSYSFFDYKNNKLTNG